MYLSRFKVTDTFKAWSPSERNCPDRRISISPSPRHLFTEDAELLGTFVKFLKNGNWYEAERSEFVRSTVPLPKHSARGAVAG
jgi:hypothetical protein